MGEPTVPFSANITLQARKILERVGASVVYNEEDQIPYGRIITAMVEWFEEENEWDDITERIRADRAHEAQERRERDRERKRKKR